MNVFKKIYFRAFQFVFRLASPLMPYREPKIYRSIEELAELFREHGVRSVMLVTDEAIRAIGISAPLEELVAGEGISLTVYDKTCPNPTVNNVEEALAMYRDGKCECIVALGGGSAMDCAKALGARVVYPEKPLSKLKGLLHVTRKIPNLIAIPTTAGTGSEVTLVAVITDSEKQDKYTIMDFNLIPRYAVLDPHVTMTLPKSLTAATGMDALTHAVEAYIGRSGTKKSNEQARAAVSLIFKYIKRAYDNGVDLESRENMLKASYLAGAAFSRAYVGYIHAIAHSLGGQYNAPHGQTNATLMPIVLECYGSSAYKKLAELAKEAGVAEEGADSRSAAESFIRAIRELNRYMGIPEELPYIKEEDIPKMAQHAYKEANPLYPVPRLMTEGELEKIYYKALGD